ncbi:hypothetical protein C0J52_01737 [Blattella germanica]|nr:hypothetical protein C0J52_01737 [Blattella germanica]
MSQYMVARERPDGSGIDFPDLLPSDRKNRAEYAICVFITICMAAGAAPIWYDSSFKAALWYIVGGFSFGVFIVGLVQLVVRFCLLIEEIYHCPARYSDVGMAAKYAFNMNMLTYLTYGISTLFVIVFTLIGGESPLKPLWEMGAFPNLMIFATSYCFSFLIKMENLLHKKSFDNEDKSEDTSQVEKEFKISDFKEEIVSMLDFQRRISKQIQQKLSRLEVSMQDLIPRMKKWKKPHILFNNQEESTLNTSLQITRLRSLDYGSGMAYNFFYGYLRLVLSTPEIGVELVKGITGRIDSYASKHGLYKYPGHQPFPIKKLFILIPQNLYTPTDLKEVSCDPSDRTKYWMESAQSLEAQELDRAGVKKRVYKNSVYKIRNPDADQDAYIYVVAEGATPLKTLYDVIEMNPRMSAIFKKHRAEIVSSFYKTLLNILNESEECRGLCEVIYYVDTDANKKKVNVAKIILERIDELQQQRNSNP